MKLHKLHILEGSASPVCHCKSIPGGHVRVGRFTVYLSASPCRQNCLLCPDQYDSFFGVPGHCAVTYTVSGNEIDGEGMLKDLDIFVFFHNTDKGMFHFLTSRITPGTDNTRETVTPFLRD